MKVKRIEHIAIAVKSMKDSEHFSNRSSALSLSTKNTYRSTTRGLRCTPSAKPTLSCWNLIAKALKPPAGSQSMARDCSISVWKLRISKAPSRSSGKRVPATQIQKSPFLIQSRRGMCL